MRVPLGWCSSGFRANEYTLMPGLEGIFSFFLPEAAGTGRERRLVGVLVVEAGGNFYLAALLLVPKRSNGARTILSVPL